MFARLTTVTVQKDRIDEAIKVFADNIVPAAKSQKGYQMIYLLINRETGKGISMSVWDSEEDAAANEKTGYYQEQVGKVAPFFTSAPVLDGYEVSAQG
ncbi:antibiotic biosynthesis monooxygenase family protein [Chloroflexota bacterium]